MVNTPQRSTSPKEPLESQNGSGESSENVTRNPSPRPAYRIKGHRVKFSEDRTKSPTEPSGQPLESRRPDPPSRTPSKNSNQKPIPALRLTAPRRSRPSSLIDVENSADVADTPLPTPGSVSATISEDAESPFFRDYEPDTTKHKAQFSAQERAQQLASLLGSASAPASRRNSTSAESTPAFVLDPPPEARSRGALPVRIDDIPLADMPMKSIYDESTDDDEDGPEDLKKKKQESDGRRGRATSTTEAHHIVRAMTGKGLNPLGRVHGPRPGLVSGQVTPDAEKDPHNYIEPPAQYRGGILSSLLKLYDHQQQGHSAARPRSMGDLSLQSPTTASSRGSSGRGTPKTRERKWYDKSANQSTTSLSHLITTSTMMAAPAVGTSAAGARPQRPGMAPRSRSGGFISSMQKLGKPRLEDEIRITVHIAEILSRQKYLIKLCRALMMYGAPTHRLEEYLTMSARVLEISSSFLYIPGCMIVSFDDVSTHTTEVKMVRANQGVDLGRLRDTHEIYKEVVHDVIGVEEATQRLDEVLTRKPKHSPWVLVPVYGLASATVGPFAFDARPIDLPVAFILGCVLGILQLIIAPKSPLYSNVFEISAAIFTSFLARAFGSIPYGDGYLFCFSALAQSSIALILPGYMVLCGSLELQSKSIVAGSVRMVYAIIYSLFLGFGITIGTAIFGLMYSNATSDHTCPSSPLSTEVNFIFVPMFTMCLIIVNQAKWKQSPVMVFISFAGYIVNHYSSLALSNNTQVSQALGAFAIGVLGNLYSRLRHGVAAAALLPAIFVQVPSGLAASGSLIAGIDSANSITGNGTSTSSSDSTDTTIWKVGYGMVQVAIGITVGLFLSALVIYPFGKKRSGLFSF